MAKLPYEPPHVRRMSATSHGKHRLAGLAAPGAWLEERLDIEGLIRKFGSPLFLLSEKTLRARINAFRDAFTSPAVDTVVAYSYKTNYLPAACAILHQEGAWAEVVSGMEYQLAKSLAVPGKKIVFNGPYKPAGELKTAIRDHALINVDNFGELREVAAHARSLRLPARIGLRINFRDSLNAWTKFGFNAENGDAEDALKLVKAAGAALHLEALHCHSGTFLLDPAHYGRVVAGLIGVAQRARRLGLAPTILDLGGGYPSGNRLKPGNAPHAKRPAEGAYLKPFAEAVFAALAKARGAFGPRPTLLLEPGRAIVDAAMRLACTVVATKSIPAAQAGAILDAGVNILPTAYWYDHDVQPATQAEPGIGITGAHRPVTLYGPLCMQIDVIRHQVLLPETKVGNTLLIDHVGAYCLTQSMQFINPRPAVVLLGTDGEEVVRRRETWRDVFALDRLPPHLVPKNSRF